MSEMDQATNLSDLGFESPEEFCIYHFDKFSKEDQKELVILGIGGAKKE